jgi:biopolymer transport protein ExbD
VAADLGDDDDGITGINITPMVDIMLVLLVIFMVTTTTINQVEGMQVDKPDAATGKTLDEIPQSILLVCHADGSYVVDGDPLDKDEDIIERIKAKLENNSDLQGVVQCDEAAQVGKMVHLIDLLRNNGVKKYAIATEKPEQDKG